MLYSLLLFRWLLIFLSTSFSLPANISKFFEGDIVLDPELEEEIRRGANSRNALRSRKRLWTSRIIPYRIPSWMSMYLFSCLLNVSIMS